MKDTDKFDEDVEQERVYRIFHEVDEDKPIATVRLLTRAMLPVKLVGKNKSVLTQVLHNRDCRRRLGTYTHSLLLVKCEIFGVSMYRDVDDIIVAYFMPSTEIEKWAVREAQWASETAAWRRNDRDPVKQAEARLLTVYATEILWLAITGCLKSAEDALTFKQGNDNSDWHSRRESETVATWNRYEPEIGLYPYQNM